MRNPLFERTELSHIARVLGALLVFFGGIALLLQAYFVDILPPKDGFIMARASVVNLEQIGSFQSPSFLVTLDYDVLTNEGETNKIRSGQRVDFEQYFELSIGQVINIHYDPHHVVQWRIEPINDGLSQYGLGFLMVIFGALSLGFPGLVSWASRREEFEFKDKFDDEVSGANLHSL